MLCRAATFLTIGLVSCIGTARADSLTLFTVGQPAGVQFVFPVGISGNTVAGTVYDGFGYRPFAHDLSTGATTMIGTRQGEARALFGNTVVGAFYGGSSEYDGFIFDGASVTTIRHPQTAIYDSLGTILQDFDGTRYLGTVGQSYPFSKLFWFDGTDFEYIDLPPPQPGAIEGFPDLVDGVTYGIDNATLFQIVEDGVTGTYYDSTTNSHVRFVLQDGQLVPFELTGPNGETVTNLRIFGDIITGNLEVAGELYTPFLFRNGEWILLQGIDPKINTVDFVDGDRIVGQYGILDNTLIRPGYVLQLDALAADEVPEPASILAWSLIAMGAFAYQRVRKQVVRAHRR